jgi:glycosyltransferase involved in cell wall biosynthesis
MIHAPPAPPEPIQVAWKPATLVKKVRPSGNTFYHSGDLGDVIFSLPTVRALGGGILVLGPDAGPHGTREKMTRKRADILLPLLKLQPYIKECGYAEKAGVNIKYNLNAFRETMVRNSPHANLAHVHLLTFNKPLTECDTAWLQVDKPVSIPGYPVLVTKTLRYPGNLDWSQVLRKYGKEIAFIGTPEEHMAFCQKYGPVYFHPTKDFLEVARLIAGCELFITNQNGCHAVAEGLKATVIQEPNPDTHTAIFERPNAWYELPDKLPEVGERKVVRQPLNISFSGPVDGFSGVGADSMSFMTGLINFGHKVWNEPTRVTALVDEHVNLQPPSVPLAQNGRPPANAIRLVFDSVEEFRNMKLVTPGDIVLTIWEASIWPSYCVMQLNRARCVVTFSKWNADTMRQSGVQVPVHVIPMCMNMETFHPRRRQDNVFTFGVAGKVGEGGQRKNLNDAARIFQAAFPWQRDVRLRMKMFSDCDVGQIPKDPRIDVVRKYLTPEELGDWFAGNDAFISLSHGEGWGHCLQDGMACGSAPIACKFGGQAEFFDKEVGYEIPFTMTPCTTRTYENYGEWAQPSESGLIEIMRRVYARQDEAFLFGQKAITRANLFPKRRMIAELERVICTSLS